MIYPDGPKGGALAREFQATASRSVFDLQTPYFNAGLMVIDRAAWRAGLGEEARRVARDPERFPFMEQDALNSLLRAVSRRSRRGTISWAISSSPGWRRAAPDRPAFCQQPKPWHYAEWRGETRFARDYADWFAPRPGRTGASGARRRRRASRR